MTVVCRVCICCLHQAFIDQHTFTECCVHSGLFILYQLSSAAANELCDLGEEM